MSLKVKKMFEKYANDPLDTQTDKIGPNGIMRLLEDLRLDAEDRKILVLAFKTGAETMCEFSWEEWERGMLDLRVDTIDGLRKRLDEIEKAMIRDPAQIKPTYMFAFKYGKTPGERNLVLDVAIPYWKILIKDQFALLPLWEEYLETQHKKPITKDVWNMVFDFAATVKPDFSNYDPEESWPCVLDGFVNWARPKVVRN